MTYSKSLTFQTWLINISDVASALDDIIGQGKDLFDKWNEMTYGLDNKSILNLPQFAESGINEEDVIKIQYAIGVFGDMDDCLNNVREMKQFDRRGDIVPFIAG